MADNHMVRDAEIERLQRQIKKLELLHHDSPDEETESDPSVWDDGDDGVNPLAGLRRDRREGEYRDDPLRNIGVKVDVVDDHVNDIELPQYNESEYTEDHVSPVLIWQHICLRPLTPDSDSILTNSCSSMATVPGKICHFIVDSYCQTMAAAPGQPTKEPMVIPVSVSLLDSQGNDLPLSSTCHDVKLESVTCNGQPIYTTVLRATKGEGEIMDMMEVVNTWFALQSSSDILESVENVRKLLEGLEFVLRNLNKVYSLSGGFCMSPVNFHANDDSGYKLVGELGNDILYAFSLFQVENVFSGYF